MSASNSQWLVEAYGAPSATSEVNQIPDFYRPEALSAFSGPLPPQRRDCDPPAVEAPLAEAAALGAVVEPRPAL